MKYIYKITNDINDKVYIGKTEYSIEKRFLEHCRDMTKRDEEKHPLYAAMKKYGVEHFTIEQIDAATTSEELSNKEIYWIGKYDSYKNGYNATLGGDGSTLFSHEGIIADIKAGKTCKDIVKKYHCCEDTVRDIAQAEGLKITKDTSNQVRISQWTKDNEFIQEFESSADAARWCFKNGYAKSLGGEVRSHITECAAGTRKSAYTFIWKYVR